MDFFDRFNFGRTQTGGNFTIKKMTAWIHIYFILVYSNFNTFTAYLKV
jgi:hypothetical protein